MSDSEDEEMKVPRDYWNSYFEVNSRVYFESGNVVGIGKVLGGMYFTAYGKIIEFQGLDYVRGFNRAIADGELHFIFDTDNETLILYKLLSEEPRQYAFRVRIQNVIFRNVEDLLTAQELAQFNLLNQPTNAPAASYTIEKSKQKRKKRM